MTFVLNEKHDADEQIQHSGAVKQHCLSPLHTHVQYDRKKKKGLKFKIHLANPPITLTITVRLSLRKWLSSKIEMSPRSRVAWNGEAACICSKCQRLVDLAMRIPRVLCHHLFWQLWTTPKRKKKEVSFFIYLDCSFFCKIFFKCTY